MAKYDIQTLMRMKQNAHIDPSRFSDQARGNNLLREHDAGVLSEQSINKPRVISNTSRRSEGVASSIGSRSYGPPRRANKSSQRDLEHADAGFVRFLKTHTSPRHQRVTAGGRIVPMASEVPPPKMNLPAVEQGAKLGGSRSWRAPAKRGGKNRPELKPTQSMGAEPTDSGSSPEPRPAGTMSEQNRVSFVDGDHDRQGSTYGFAPSISSAFSPGAVWQPSLPSPLVNVPVEQLYAPSQMPTLPIYPMYTVDPGKIAWVPTVYQTGNAQGFPVGSLPRPPQHGSPISMLPDNQAWNNVNSVPPPGFSQCVPGYDSPYPTINPQWQQLAHDPTLSQSHLPHIPGPPPSHNSLDHADKAYDNLSAELSRIDRYMALHTWDISSDKKASMVEQRRKLVRELDAVRMYKEHLELIAGKSASKDLGMQQNAAAGLSTPELHTPMHSDGHQRAPGSMLSGPASLDTSRPSLRPSLANQFPSLGPASGRHGKLSASKSVRSPYIYRHGAGPEDTPSRLALRKFESSSGGLDDGETSGTLARAGHSHNPKVTTGTTGDGDRWVVSTNPLERKLRRLYHKIQMATRRGEPSKELLKQLSDVTGQLLKEGSEESNPESQKSASDQQLVTRFGTQSDVTPGKSDPIESSSPVEHSPKKPWKSEAHTRDLGVGAQQPTPFWVDTSDSKTLSSGSTTDSWASVGESDKHLFTGSSCKKGNDKGSQDLYKSCSSSSAEKRIASVGPTRGGISNLDGEASTSNPKRNHPPLLTQCLSRHRGSILQKTAAVTAPQSINAHAMMPQTDGPADSPLDRGEIAPRDANNRTGTVLNADARGGYLPRVGVSPSLLDIQELFHRISRDGREQVTGVVASAQEPLEAFIAGAVRSTFL
ncbi:hypothetical protein P168DRAFT_282377 [Aspergillus campestris IBT 28561]|uniref:Uncharacterized protein n=1 Tax=Aspergillus campestris (strain IBT 28561) TaxID=1392248 RepID=A0A2I1D1A3_ASPC2|nr:uncharacterized protein P168DRAFT_282377 [Aspergillus campestris IBT 28561]PKY03653.1 hypothetical protein P168DRAFT_282377 [Aspergillus campestris IBT 28561]